MLRQLNTNVLQCALLGAFLLAVHPQARAALTCEQLLAVTQEAIRQRDQGYSLTQVSAALKDVETQNNLTKAEFDVLQKAVSAAYLSQASPEEITLECVKSGRLGKPTNADPRRD